LFVAIPTVLHYLNNEVLTEAIASRLVRRRTIGNAMPILIIEPGRMIGKALKADLLANNYTKIDWMIGVASISPFIGITPGNERKELDPLAYRIVILDYLKQDPIEAPEIAKMLTTRGVVCISISVERRLNERVVELGGAKAGIIKSVFLQGLIGGHFTLDELVQNPEISGILNELAELETEMRGSRAARRSAGDLLDLLRTEEK